MPLLLELTLSMKNHDTLQAGNAVITREKDWLHLQKAETGAPAMEKLLPHANLSNLLILIPPGKKGREIRRGFFSQDQHFPF